MPEETPQQPQAPTPPPAPQPPQPGAVNPYGQPPKKKTGMIVGIIVGAVVLLAGVATLLIILLSNDNDSKDKKTDDSKSSSKQETKKEEKSAKNDDKLRAANAKTAKSMSDLSNVCKVGSVSNAAEFTKPYKVAAFSKADGRSDYWSMVSLEYNAPYAVKYDEFTQVNTVACLSEKDDAQVKTKTCDFKSGDEAISIDYYATTFELTVYEAKSGKKIKDLGEVGAPATTCPMFASYNNNDPKIVAKPDSAAVDALIKEFTQ
jgi:hypothetical protein